MKEFRWAIYDPIKDKNIGWFDTLKKAKIYITTGLINGGYNGDAFVNGNYERIYLRFWVLGVGSMISIRWRWKMEKGWPGFGSWI